MDAKELIVRRVAKEMNKGDVVNLGIGIPTLVANYLDQSLNILLQSENGLIGLDSVPEPGKENYDLVNAGGQVVTMLPYGATFDSSMSFSIIRGGHVDVTVLGALQVDTKGNLASWIIPGKKVPGMGGSMDLVVGAKKVIIAMQHTSNGEIKIVDECTLPLTASGQVDLIITELAVMKVMEDGIHLLEIAADTTVEEVQKVTGPKLIVSENLKTIEY